MTSRLPQLRKTFCVLPIGLKLIILLIEGCGELKSLMGLNIQNCNNLVSLPDLSALPNLEIIGVPAWLFEWELSGKKAYNMMIDGFPSQPIELNFRNFQGSSLPEGKLTHKFLIRMTPRPEGIDK